jgi:DNA polymerase-1
VASPCDGVVCIGRDEYNTEPTHVVVTLPFDADAISEGTKQKWIEVCTEKSLLSGSYSPRLSFELRATGQLERRGTVTGRFTCEGATVTSMFKQRASRTRFDASNRSIQLRRPAAFAGEETMLGAFRRGKDEPPPKAVALFGKPVPTITPTERQCIKPISVGVGVAPFQLWLVALAPNECGVELSGFGAEWYRARFFSPRLWRKAVVERAPTSTTRFGRMRRWAPGNDGDGARLAFPVQGSAADIMKSCVVELYLPLKAMGAAILLVVHDELIVEAPSETADAVRKMLEASMPEIASRLFPEVPFVVNARCCKTLGAHQ